MERFFKKIFSSDSNEEPKEPPLTKFRELESAWQDFQKENFGAAIEKANNYNNNQNPKIRFEANKLIGLGNFRLGNFKDAQLIFEKLTYKSNDPDDWFNLVTSSTLSGDIDKGKSAFDKSIEIYKKNGKRENLSIPNMMFYYMQCLKDVSRYELAFEQLEGLRKIYSELKITDSTFLYLRGVPFFEHTIDASEDIFKNMDIDKSCKWLDEFKQEVDNEGKQYISELQARLKNAS